MPQHLICLYLQDILSSDVSDEGLHALAVNNCVAAKLVLARPEEQRQVALAAIKQSETFFDKACHPYPVYKTLHSILKPKRL